MPSKVIERMSDEELAVEAEALAATRTEIRLRQNAITVEQETRRALAGVSGATREALSLRLGGTVSPAGEAKEVQP